MYLRVFLRVRLQVKVNNEVATGTGPNKKVAKRNAAEAMLLQLGYKASSISQNPSEVPALLVVSHSLQLLYLHSDYCQCR